LGASVPDGIDLSQISKAGTGNFNQAAANGLATHQEQSGNLAIVSLSP